MAASHIITSILRELFNYGTYSILQNNHYKINKNITALKLKTLKVSYHTNGILNNSKLNVSNTVIQYFLSIQIKCQVEVSSELIKSSFKSL